MVNLGSSFEQTYDGQESLLLHTKFRGYRFSGSGEEDFEGFFTIYGRGGHLGHVTSNMSINFHFLVPEKLTRVRATGPPMAPNAKKKLFWHKNYDFGENKWRKKNHI